VCVCVRACVCVATAAVPWVPLVWQTHRRPLAATRASHLRTCLARTSLARARKAERQAAKEARLQSLVSDSANTTSDKRASGGFGDPPPGWDAAAWAEGPGDGGGGGRARGVSAAVAAGGGDGAFTRTALFGVEESAVEEGGASEAKDDETPVQRMERQERERLHALRSELDSIYTAIDAQRSAAEGAATAEAALTAAARQLAADIATADAEHTQVEENNAVRKPHHIHTRTPSHPQPSIPHPSPPLHPCLLRQVRKRALELATDPKGSRARLQEAVKQSAAALMVLAEEWEGHRAPLLDELREAQRARQSRKEGAVAKMSAVKTLRTEMRGMVGELQARDENLGRLQTELSKAKGANRASYTERILDVVRNLRKQKEEIRKILADIRDSQKDVNALQETLQRSFSAADEVIFRDAVKSAASKQCYKALARMHEAFANLVEHAQVASLLQYPLPLTHPHLITYIPSPDLTPHLTAVLIPSPSHAPPSARCAGDRQRRHHHRRATGQGRRALR
jgi:DNA repair exonuclease SbcCD ATPase subunit